MSTTPTNVNFDDIQPPAKPDSFNAEWQADIPVPDPNSPGNLVRNVSVCYQTPHVGGVIVLADDYQLSDTDSGLLLIANSSSAITFTLPLAVPNLPNPQGIWRIKIKNFGTGDLNIDPNGLNLDGSALVLVVPQNSGFDIETDGTDYWSYGNFGVGSGTGAAAIAALFSDAEVPSGSINSSNTAFTLANSPTPSGSLELYLNGQFLTNGTDYTLSGSAITMTVAPTTGDILLAFYRYGTSGGNFVDNETPSGTINSSNVTFTLANIPNPASSLALFLDGLVLKSGGVDYSLSGLTITMIVAPVTGAILRAFYRFISATAYNFAGEETPSGAINGSNVTFGLAHAVSPAASLRLYLDGSLMKASVDYTLSGSTITMIVAPTTGDKLYAFYRY